MGTRQPAEKSSLLLARSGTQPSLWPPGRCWLPGCRLLVGKGGWPVRSLPLHKARGPRTELSDPSRNVVAQPEGRLWEAPMLLAAPDVWDTRVVGASTPRSDCSAGQALFSFLSAAPGCSWGLSGLPTLECLLWWQSPLGLASLGSCPQAWTQALVVHRAVAGSQGCLGSRAVLLRVPVGW